MYDIFLKKILLIFHKESKIKLFFHNYLQLIFPKKVNSNYFRLKLSTINNS